MIIGCLKPKNQKLINGASHSNQKQRSEKPETQKRAKPQKRRSHRNGEAIQTRNSEARNQKPSNGASHRNQKIFPYLSFNFEPSTGCTPCSQPFSLYNLLVLTAYFCDMSRMVSPRCTSCTVYFFSALLRFGFM